MAEFANLSSSFPEQTNGRCRGLVAQNVFLGVVCFLGITTNSVLLAFIWKYRHGTLTPDKMLLMNYAAVDLIACLVSLPLHITALNGSLDLADNDGRILILIHSFYPVCIHAIGNTRWTFQGTEKLHVKVHVR